MRIGIDLGTTNSACAVWQDGTAVLIPNDLGELLTPSAVSIDAKGTLLVGRPALERQSVDPARTATAFKRYMGTQHKSRLGGKHYMAEELSALILGSLKADAERHMGEPVDGAIVTVPAYFNDRQRKATRRAGELAGLKIERLINEPTAAALAFGIQERAEREPFLVFDLGGGTFDVSIVEIFDGIMEVRASAGDNRLGGEDFNDALAVLMRAKIDPERTLDKVDPLLLREKLNVAAEAVRRELSVKDRAKFSLVVEGVAHDGEISSAEFEEQVAGLISRLREPVLSDQLSDIVLVGGGTRMPVVRRAIAKMFGRFPNHLVHPDHAVALGAAVQAGLLAKDSALSEIRMTDICPFTLGIEHTVRDNHGRMHGGQFSPIIDRNTPIPVSRVAQYSTVADLQKQILVNIYQGEARNVADNVQLGSIKVPIPPRPAGEVSIDCRFTYDTSGLLEVDVAVPSIGKTHSLVILDDSASMDSDEIDRRRKALESLKRHPREEAANIAILARAERCFEDFLGERRDQIGAMTATFQSIVDTQDDRAITLAREEFGSLLDSLEAEKFL